MKRFISFCLSIAIVVSISGCSGTDNKTGTNSGKTTADLTGRIDNIIQEFGSGDTIDSTIIDELKKNR